MIYISSDIDLYIHTVICMNLFKYVIANILISLYLSSYVHIHIFICVYIFLLISIFEHIHIHAYIYIIYMYIYLGCIKGKNKMIRILIG